MNTILKISNLQKKYSGFSLSDINLEVKQGNIVGLVGENGAGKTTLISLILNQRIKDEGKIEIFGKDNIIFDSEIKQKIGFFNDECCFHSCFTAMDINKILKSIYRNWDKNQYLEYLDQFKIKPNKKIKDMSKGTKSKLMLAVSLTYSPSLLIFDEITSGLDPIIRNTILQILKDYVKASNATIFFSTHITSDLENIANEVLLLHEGKIYFHKTMKELHENYLIYECNLEKYHSIPQKGIERVLIADNNCFLLAQRNCACKEFFNEYKIPLVDDIMHFYIEGEACR